jgi:hypothetical protein
VQKKVDKSKINDTVDSKKDECISEIMETLATIGKLKYLGHNNAQLRYYEKKI